ncbi:MAG: hypothetical protein IT440_11415 [Phycisphaeraceae bacterium]|nr:hypothetical protein [Phycisphaeraceae bacterium]
MLDSDGLCRSFLCARTLAPWTHDDLQVYDLTDFFQNAPDKGGCLSYENSLMATGEWTCSQLARHAVTGDAEAMRVARQSARAILAVAEEGRHYMPGYLPKPFGGVAHCRDSHEISPDQYARSLLALQTWKPLAGSDAVAIDRLIVDAADFFIARKWRHAYRHRTILTAETHQHALGLFVPLCVLAGNIAGPRYHAQLKTFDHAIDLALDNDSLHNFNMLTLLIDGLHLALTAGHDDPRLGELIVRLWKRGAACVDETGRGFEHTDKPRVTSQATRLASLATIVDRYDRALEAPAMAIRILRHYRGLDQMRHYQPEDVATVRQHLQWLGHSIDDTSITGWLLAYWRLRAAGELI